MYSQFMMHSQKNIKLMTERMSQSNKTQTLMYLIQCPRYILNISVYAETIFKKSNTEILT